MKLVVSIVGGAAVAAACSLVVGCHSSSSADKSATSSPSQAIAVTVTAAKPARHTLRLESDQPGQIEAFEYTPLFAKLPAYVGKLHVDIGDHVESDQILIELFLPELTEEVHQKEAALAEADAGIAQAEASIRAAEATAVTAEAKINEMQAGTIRANADYQRWESQFTRISELASSGSVDHKLEDETRNSMKAAEAARSEALAKLESAKAALVESQAGVARAKASEAVARARKESARADLSRQQALLSYAQIRAPYGGVVTERNVNRGDFVQPANSATVRPLLAVARFDMVRIFVDVPEMESSWVKTGQTANVNIQALPGRRVEGKVARTSWALGANRTLRTELDIENPDAVLRPGMYATARILLQERPAALVLPPPAIVRDGRHAYAWVVKDGRAMRVPITAGLQVGNDVEVVSGLNGDELVIQNPNSSLQDGQPVELAAQPAAR